MIAPSQGVHLVLDRSFLPGDHAIMVPHTDDGRVLFVIPWHGRTLVGTTDTPMRASRPSSRGALPEEIEFILRNARPLPGARSRPRTCSRRLRGHAAAGAGRGRRRHGQVSRASHVVHRRRRRVS